jgi:hypothetical protein
VLDHLETDLERQLVEPLDPDYEVYLTHARALLRYSDD